MKKVLIGLLVLMSMATYASSDLCIDVYEKGVLKARERIKEYSLSSSIEYMGPEMVKSAWTFPDVDLVTPTLYTIASPVLSVIGGSGMFLLNYPSAKKDLKIYKRLLKVLKDQHSDETVDELKDLLDVNDLSNDDFVNLLKKLSVDTSLCTRYKAEESLSDFGMERVKERGYNSAKEAMLAGKDTDKCWWESFKRDSDNFYRNIFGSLGNDKLEKLIKKNY